MMVRTDVRRHLGIRKSDLGGGITNRRDPISFPDPKGFATGPEKSAHKDPKTWVAAHPGMFKRKYTGWYGMRVHDRRRHRIHQDSTLTSTRVPSAFDNGSQTNWGVFLKTGSIVCEASSMCFSDKRGAVRMRRGS